MLRTHTCGELKKINLGQKVELAGWVDEYRNLGGLLFVDLRDAYGLIQLTFDPKAAGDLWPTAAGLRHEWVIKIRGEVVARPATMVNKNLPTGEIEIRVEDLAVLAKADDLPFSVNNEDKVGQAGETLRLQYRFLDLRRPKLQAMLTAKDRVFTYIRQYFHDRGFREVQTPILANSSPEGARDFLIASRLHPGKFYALPQAPQQFKQLLMVGGVDKYFQIAPCFRDEDVRADRHYGEFYQLDMEMSFADQEDVFAVMEPLMRELTEKFSQKKLINLPMDKSFPRLAWREAMTCYGTDKPDLRYDLKIAPVGDSLIGCEFGIFEQTLAAGGAIHALALPAEQFSRKAIDDLETAAKAKGAGGLAYFTYQDGAVSGGLAKFIKEETLIKVAKAAKAPKRAVVVLAAGPWRIVCAALGAVRQAAAERLALKDNGQAAWCWIVDYPMFEASEEGGLAKALGHRIDFGHNPFSLPQGGLSALKQQDPLDILAYQYDLVLNGFEISSGAVRNADPELMYEVFAVAGYDREEVDRKFGALIRAFRYGAPPHAGNAPGLDRLLMVLNDWDSIRDLYAFPKDGRGRDVLMDSPGTVMPEQLSELGIKLVKGAKSDGQKID